MRARDEYAHEHVDTVGHEEAVDVKPLGQNVRGEEKHDGEGDEAVVVSFEFGVVDGGVVEALGDAVECEEENVDAVEAEEIHAR